MLESIKLKISKLLALAAGGNDEESHTAMLQARNLMLKYNLTESEISANNATGEINTKKVTNNSVMRTKLLWWHIHLAIVIASHFRCSHYINKYGSYDKEIRFVGLDEDVEVATLFFNFGVESIKYNSQNYLNRKEIKRKWKRKHQFKNDYIEGYIQGLNQKFIEQNQSESLELILTQHTLVTEYFNSLNLVNIDINQPKKAADHNSWNEGYKEGKKFDKDKKRIN